MNSSASPEPDRRLFMSYGHDPVYLDRADGDLNKALQLLHHAFPANEDSLEVGPSKVKS
ncbi:MAG: hypothetical protein JJU05_11940 [Verrucomicrobia bacterium]|nr:hypothetical protein [Verrucomicrobiota bacterium]